MAETYSRDEFGVIRALDALGRTDDQIAARLLDLGYGGEQCMAHACPIARYLESIYRDITVYVEPGLIKVFGLDEAVSIWPEEPVTDFIEHFDAGVYPELIKEAA